MDADFGSGLIDRFKNLILKYFWMLKLALDLNGIIRIFDLGLIMKYSMVLCVNKLTS